MVREGSQVLTQIASLYGFQVEFEEGLVGGASIDAYGKPLTDPVLKLAKQSDAVLLGAMGGPKWDGLDYSIRPERALLALRQELGLFANLRPVKLFSALASASTLRREVVEGTDLLVVRELIGGIYFGQPKGITKLPDGTERGVNTEVYTTPEIERIAKSNRRIGLGVMGWAECLVKMGIAFDSQESLALAEKVMRFINTAAREASEKLAKERGVFVNWKDSIYDPNGPHYRGATSLARNCARTTIAPTGTIAIAAGLQGSGIEPFFAIAYTRYNARALDALKQGKSPDAKDVFFEVNPLFKQIAEENRYFGLSKNDLWKKINDNHKAVRGVAEVPPWVQKLFPTAHDVAVEHHVQTQAAFQRHVDNGVSKTINLPNTATQEDIRRAYQLAFDLGCKGVTIYRDGSKSQQVLNLSSASGAGAPGPKTRRRDPTDSFGVKSEYYLIKTGYGPLHIHINYDERGPYQVFTNIPPLGTEISGLTSLLGIMLSKYLAEGGDPIRILKHLNAVKGDRPLGFGENRIDSIPHAVSVAMRQHLKHTGWLSDNEAENKKTVDALLELAKTQHCPKCYSSNVAYESGCSKPACKDCGHSECS